MKNSSFLKLNWQDYAKGLIVAVGTTVLTALMTSLNSGHLPQGKEWAGIGTAAISAAVAYLLKNLFTNSDGTIGGKEVK
jgi:hypothetical protein